MRESIGFCMYKFEILPLILCQGKVFFNLFPCDALLVTLSLSLMSSTDAERVLILISGLYHVVLPNSSKWFFLLSQYHLQHLL